MTETLAAPRGEQVRVEPCPKRVRVVVGGAVVADSAHPLLLLEAGHLPVYYFPRGDVRADVLEPSSTTSYCPHKGEASYYSLRVGEVVVEDAAWSYESPLPGREDIASHLAFYWTKADAWFEEDDEVYVHPRDPYHRVDVLNSSRHVRVAVGGETVADSRRPRLVFETGLPTRYYLPRADVRTELLVPSPTTSQCPTRGSPRTGPSRPGASGWRTACGATASPSRSARRSRASWPSSTSEWTSGWTGSSRRGPRRPGRRNWPRHRGPGRPVGRAWPPGATRSACLWPPSGCQPGDTVQRLGQPALVLVRMGQGRPADGRDGDEALPSRHRGGSS